MDSFDQERTVARDAARRAGLLCLAIRREMLRAPESMHKVHQEPVTIADWGAQVVIMHLIAEYMPGDCTVAEERTSEFDILANEQQHLRVVHHVGEALGHHVTLDDVRTWLDYGCHVNSPRVWMVDPIDGTKGFLRGDQFAVAIGFAVDGKLTAAALACPQLPLYDQQSTGPRGAIFTAVRGRGATVEPLQGGRARLIQVSTDTRVAQARVLESVEPGHTDHAFTARVLEAAGISGESVRMDSQAKYGAVADGRAEIYIRRSRGADYHERVWDHAAGALIVQEAGGVVTDLDGLPLDFTQGRTLRRNQGVLATSGAVHDLILDAVRQVEG